MRSLFLLIPVLCLLTSAPARADFNAGMAAYERGDFKAAMTEWLPLAETGDAEAQYRVGRLYGFGDGVQLDTEAAANWFRLAANQKHIVATYNLGHIYWHGQGMPADYEQAVTWFRIAADKGDAPAQNYLGLAYSHGQGVEENQENAVYWFLRAAKQGNINGQGALSFHYLVGEGVEKDLIKAYMWNLLVLEKTDRIPHYLTAPYFWFKTSAEDRKKAAERARHWVPQIEDKN